MRKTGNESEELAFLGEIRQAELALPTPRIAAVRGAVWRRIEEEKRIARINMENLKLNRSLTRWDVAAALAVVVGADSLYGCVKQMMAEMYWSGSLHVISYIF